MQLLTNLVQVHGQGCRAEVPFHHNPVTAVQVSKEESRIERYYKGSAGLLGQKLGSRCLLAKEDLLSSSPNLNPLDY